MTTTPLPVTGAHFIQKVKGQTAFPKKKKKKEIKETTQFKILASPAPAAQMARAKIKCGGRL